MLYMTCMQTRIMVVSCFEVLQLLATPAGTGCSLPRRKLRRHRRRQRRRRARLPRRLPRPRPSRLGCSSGRASKQKSGHPRHLGSSHRLEVSGEDCQGASLQQTQEQELQEQRHHVQCIGLIGVPFDQIFLALLGRSTRVPMDRKSKVDLCDLPRFPADSGST